MCKNDKEKSNFNVSVMLSMVANDDIARGHGWLWSMRTLETFAISYDRMRRRIRESDNER